MIVVTQVISVFIDSVRYNTGGIMRVKYVASVFFLILGILRLSSLCYGQGKAIYFDGTGDYIDLGSNQTQDGMDGATGLTLETWVNPSSLRSVS